MDENTKEADQRSITRSKNKPLAKNPKVQTQQNGESEPRVPDANQQTIKEG